MMHRTMFKPQINSIAFYFSVHLLNKIKFTPNHVFNYEKQYNQFNFSKKQAILGSDIKIDIKIINLLP